MCDSKFNAAGFLDHHFFQNGILRGLHDKAMPPYRIHVFEIQEVLERIVLFHESGKLNEALPDVPEDIMLFLFRYSFPVKELGEKLSKEGFSKYYEAVMDHLVELMEKYGAR